MRFFLYGNKSHNNEERRTNARTSVLTGGASFMYTSIDKGKNLFDGTFCLYSGLVRARPIKVFAVYDHPAVSDSLLYINYRQKEGGARHMAIQ